MSAREAALQTLVAMDHQKAWSNGHLKKVIQEAHLDRRDAALATRLCFGVLQNRMLLDHYLQQYSTMKLTKMESKVRNSLRLGLYQMLFLTKIPVSAAVSESVALTKKLCKNPRAGGMVNGILRNLARHLDDLPTLDRSHPIAYLSLLYSHPQWLVEDWGNRLDGEELEALLRWDNSEPPVTVQVNTCRFQTPEVVEQLQREGMAVTPHPWLADCLTLTATGDLTQSEGWRQGMFYPQDPAARLAVLAAGLTPGCKVLDACAAPGGKSFAAAMVMGDRGEIHACDLHPHKKSLIQAGADRLGLQSITPQVADGKKPRKGWGEAFDVVLADVPCSGLGVLRKKPEIRYKAPEALEGLPQIQGEILANVSTYVRPGGVLLYSTCTLRTQENEAVVQAFLASHPDFRLEVFRLPGPWAWWRRGSAPSGPSGWRPTASSWPNSERRVPMPDFKSMTPEELAAWCKDQGQPAFRGKQLFQWLHRGVTSTQEMTDLPKAFRAILDQAGGVRFPTVARKQVSKLDGTIKYLWRLPDGHCIETVLMRYRHGNSVCISSQVGCAMGCVFCASTLGGRVRNLTAGELLDQVIFTQKDSGLPISNIVLMGIGEPLDNYDNVRRFLTLVNRPEGVHIGMRHISLSTCGLVKGIDRLAEEGLQITLSVSLHAPDDETRSRLMPVNRATGVEALFAACRRYFEKTGRRISYEYAMIDGVNDTPRHAALLADRLAGTVAHVNLIPLNFVEESSLRPSPHVAAFQRQLEQRGITATVRRRLGSDIDASCGQLRRKAMQAQAR